MLNPQLSCNKGNPCESGRCSYFPLSDDVNILERDLKVKTTFHVSI